MSTRYIMRLPEVTQKTGYKRASLYNFIKEGKFPPPKSLGGRAVGWDSTLVQAWIDAKLGVNQ